MLRRTASLALAATFAFATAPASAAITYDFNLPLDAGSATGTITTNGAFGLLGALDIQSYTINVAGLLGATDTLTNLNSAVYLQGSRLSADATNIYFDFTAGGPGSGFFLIQKVQNSGANYICAADTTADCYAGTTAVPQHITNPTAVFGHPTGLTILASVASVPEPTTWAMLIVGFATVGMTMRRQRIRRVAFA
jgi:hypothetical protein